MPAWVLAVNVCTGGALVVLLVTYAVVLVVETSVRSWLPLNERLYSWLLGTLWLGTPFAAYTFARCTHAGRHTILYGLALTSALLALVTLVVLVLSTVHEPHVRYVRAPLLAVSALACALTACTCIYDLCCFYLDDDDVHRPLKHRVHGGDDDDDVYGIHVYERSVERWAVNAERTPLVNAEIDAAPVARSASAPV